MQLQIQHSPEALRLRVVKTVKSISWSHDPSVQHPRKHPFPQVVLGIRGTKYIKHPLLCLFCLEGITSSDVLELVVCYQSVRAASTHPPSLGKDVSGQKRLEWLKGFDHRRVNTSAGWEEKHVGFPPPTPFKSCNCEAVAWKNSEKYSVVCLRWWIAMEKLISNLN